MIVSDLSELLLNISSRSESMLEYNMQASYITLLYVILINWKRVL